MATPTLHVALPSMPWRDITALQNPAAVDIAQSRVLVCLDGGRVSVDARVRQADGTGSRIGSFVLPSGFWPVIGVNRPGSGTLLTAIDTQSTAPVSAAWNWYMEYQGCRGFTLGQYAATTRTFQVSGSFRTPQPIPAQAPGIPA